MISYCSETLKFIFLWLRDDMVSDDDSFEGVSIRNLLEARSWRLTEETSLLNRFARRENWSRKEEVLRRRYGGGGGAVFTRSCADEDVSTTTTILQILTQENIGSGGSFDCVSNFSSSSAPSIFIGHATVNIALSPVLYCFRGLIGRMLVRLGWPFVTIKDQRDGFLPGDNQTGGQSWWERRIWLVRPITPAKKSNFKIQGLTRNESHPKLSCRQSF